MNRLKELRKKRKLTQQQLAEYIGVTKRTIVAWAREERDIKPQTSRELASFFGVSIGYLLGFTDIEQQYDDENILEFNDEFVFGTTSQKRKKDEYNRDLSLFIEFLRKTKIVISDSQINQLFSLLDCMNIFSDSSIISEFISSSILEEEIEIGSMKEKGYTLLAENIVKNF